MAKKILRQAMRVSIKELKDLIDELSKEGRELAKKLGLSDSKLLEIKRLIPIINKLPKASDTWEIDKGRIKPNKKFLEAMKRMHARKKKIKQSEVNDLIQEVRYGKKV